MKNNVAVKYFLLHSKHNLSILKPFNGSYWGYKECCNAINEAGDGYLDSME